MRSMRWRPVEVLVKGTEGIEQLAGPPEAARAVSSPVWEA